MTRRRHRRHSAHRKHRTKGLHKRRHGTRRARLARDYHVRGRHATNRTVNAPKNKW